MKVKKYKIARRLGPQVFEKTQGPTFAAKEARRKPDRSRRRGNRSVYATQLLEKQKARFTYGLSEKQFRAYFTDALAKKGISTADYVFEKIERRLDNVVLRAGFATTRGLARQIVSHGHITVNGRKLNVASYQVKDGDVIGIREGSANKTLFVEVEQQMTDAAPNAEWISIDVKAKTATVKSAPVYKPTETHFDISTIIQFYNR